MESQRHREKMQEALLAQNDAEGLRLLSGQDRKVGPLLGPTGPLMLTLPPADDHADLGEAGDDGKKKKKKIIKKVIVKKVVKKKPGNGAAGGAEDDGQAAGGGDDGEQQPAPVRRRRAVGGGAGAADFANAALV